MTRKAGRPALKGKEIPEGLPWLRVQRSLKKRKSGCWEFTGAKSSSGYGSLKVWGRAFVAHRVACEAVHGPAPEGKPLALHSCSNKLCCNPAHLRWGTQKENMGEADDRGERKRKLSPEIAAACREAHVWEGATCRSLAEKHGVTFQNMFLTLRGKQWNR